MTKARPDMITYEQQLDGNIDWALREGSMHFERESAVHKTLRKIIDLKLASGMSNAARRKDIADVQELIRVLSLSEALADQLDASVQPMYRQLWSEVRSNSSDP